MWQRVFRVALVTGAVLSAAAHAQRPRGLQPVACNESNESCREDCTMEFGTSTRTRAQLGRCLQRCEGSHQTCTERWYELQHAGIEAPDEPRAPVRAARPSEPSPPPPRPRESDDVAPYRAEESTRTRFAAPEPSGPAAASAPAGRGRDEVEGYDDAAPLSTVDAEEAPAPTPRREERPRAERTPREKPAAEEKKKKPSSNRPELPPEPKHDISDWDPDGR